MIEQARETAALMLGSDKSRGYCLEMICADFIAGANLQAEDSEGLLFGLCRSVKFLNDDDKMRFLEFVNGAPSESEQVTRSAAR